MVIRSINSVFMRHSRWLFGIFTVVIIISFLGFLTPGQFGVGGCSDPGTIRVGMAFGEPVSYNDLRSAMQSMTLYYRLAYGANPGQLDQMQAFNVVCLQRAAERRGLVASDTEIAELIRQLPIFQEGGQFDYKKYETVCANLRREGYDGDMIAAAFRSAVLQNKLMQEMMASVVVTPGEVTEFFRYANEKYEVKIAEFQRDAYAKDLKVEAAALADFFKQNRANYTIPVQLTAIIVEFPFDRPEVLKQAAAVDEETVRQYYEDNKAAFARDGKEVPAYDKIRNEVKARCVADRARAAVGRQAQEFARAAYDAVGESDDKQTAFLKLAAAEGLSVIRPGKFAADAIAIGTLQEPELVTRLAAVFDSVPVSDAVSGKTAAYVGMVVAREEERPAEFNEVNLKVQEDYIASATTRLAREAAERAAKELAALPADKRLASALWTGTQEFTLVNPPLTRTGSLVVEAALGLGPGELSPVLPTPDGAMIVTVAKRTAPDMAELAKSKEQWDMIWRQQKTGVQQADFQEFLNSQCVFELAEAAK